MQWVVGSYVLIFAALILTAGSLGDRFGAQRMLCTGFAVSILASVACGLAGLWLARRYPQETPRAARIDAIRIARQNGWLQPAGCTYVHRQDAT